MPHPETIPKPGQRKSPLSPLMQAKAKAVKGEKVNFCPFGCTERHVDANGYCRHLVGFTNDGKTYEPMVRINGKRVVQCRMKATGEKDEDGGDLMEPVLEQMQPGDKLVQITVSHRVYRNVDAVKKAG